MQISRNRFIDEVAKHINDNNAAVFMGAGISASTGLPTWSAIIKPLAKKLGLEITPETDLYQIAQFYENNYMRNEIVREYEKTINVIPQDSSFLNAAIDLGFREIWTTNYDKVIEKNLEVRGVVAKVINSDMNLNSFTDSGVHVFKLNGDIADPANMVITKADLEKYPVSHELMITFLKRELISKSFLFLGYSFSDTLILGSLASIKNCLNDSCSVHYTLLERKENQYFVDDLFRRYNIQALQIDSREELPAILKGIKAKCIEKRIFISGAFDNLPPAEDDFADALCRAIVEKIYLNGYIISSGMGRKLGNYVSGHAFEYLSRTNPYDIEKKLLMWPFFEKMTDKEKTDHRRKMIDESNICLFIFGKSPSTDGNIVISNGVKEEFNIAAESGKAIIPLPTTKYAAEEIYQTVKRKLTLFPYLEPYTEVLERSFDPDKLAEAVINICDDYLLWRNQAQS